MKRTYTGLYTCRMVVENTTPTEFNPEDQSQNKELKLERREHHC